MNDLNINKYTTVFTSILTYSDTDWKVKPQEGRFPDNVTSWQMGQKEAALRDERRVRRGWPFRCAQCSKRAGWHWGQHASCWRGSQRGPVGSQDRGRCRGRACQEPRGKSQPEEVTSCSLQGAAHIPGLIQNASWQPGQCLLVLVVSTTRHPSDLCALGQTHPCCWRIYTLTAC